MTRCLQLPASLQQVSFELDVGRVGYWYKICRNHGDVGEDAVGQERESREFMQVARAVGFDREGTRVASAPKSNRTTSPRYNLLYFKPWD